MSVHNHFLFSVHGPIFWFQSFLSLSLFTSPGILFRKRKSKKKKNDAEKVCATILDFFTVTRFIPIKRPIITICKIFAKRMRNMYFQDSFILRHIVFRHLRHSAHQSFFKVIQRIIELIFFIRADC